MGAVGMDKAMIVEMNAYEWLGSGYFMIVGLWVTMKGWLKFVRKWHDANKT